MEARTALYTHTKKPQKSKNDPTPHGVSPHASRGRAAARVGAMRPRRRVSRLMSFILNHMSRRASESARHIDSAALKLDTGTAGGPRPRGTTRTRTRGAVLRVRTRARVTTVYTRVAPQAAPHTGHSTSRPTRQTSHTPTACGPPFTGAVHVPQITQQRSLDTLYEHQRRAPIDVRAARGLTPTAVGTTGRPRRRAYRAQ